MSTKSSNSITYVTLFTNVNKGRFYATVFQSNNVLRTDKRYIKKYLLKKLAKNRK